MLGASVTLLSRDEASLKEALAGLKAARGQQHDYIVTDFIDTEEVEAKMKKHLEVEPLCRQ